MRVLKKLMAYGAVLIGGVLLTGCGSTYQVVRGDFAPLGGVKQFNVVYDYQGMSVGDFVSEEAYIKDSVAERNSAEAGSGDKWKAEWLSNKSSLYQPKFEELLNSRLRGAGVEASSGLTGAPYTLHVKLLHIEPGWNAGIMRQPTHINIGVTISKTGDPSSAIAELRAENIPGADAMGFDYSASSRLVQAFAKAGKELGSLLAEEAF
jgi:hypothetical protein